MHLYTGNAPLPQTSRISQEFTSSDHESDSSVTVTVVKAEVHTNEDSGATDHKSKTDAAAARPQDQPAVIRTQLDTNVSSESGRKSVESDNVQPTEDNEQTIAGPPIYTPLDNVQSDNTKPLSIETKVHIEDIEEAHRIVLDSALPSAGECSSSTSILDNSGPTAISDSSQGTSQDLPVSPSEYLEPITSMTTLPGSSGTGASGNMSEKEKRLSALKDAWGSQDNEDLAYLQVVL